MLFYRNENFRLFYNTIENIPNIDDQTIFLQNLRFQKRI